MNPKRFLEMSRLRYCLLLFCAAAPLYGPAAHADFIISVSSAMPNAGSTGNMLEVDLQNTGNSAQVFGGFTFGISTTSPGISFTDATNATTAYSYIFASDSLAGPPPSSIAITTGTSLSAADFSSGSGDIVDAGATVGLGEVSFDVASDTTPALYTVTLAAYPTTSLTDASFPIPNNIAFTASNGSITVIGPLTSVPEPSALVLAFLSCPAGLWMAWRQRIAAARAARNAAGDVSAPV